jgi:hypothetical protein
LLEIAFVAFKDGVLVGKWLKGLGGRRR